MSYTWPESWSSQLHLTFGDLDTHSILGSRNSNGNNIDFFIISVLYYSVKNRTEQAIGLASRTKKALYYYLLAVTGSDILSQLFIIFVGFLLETAVFHRDVPALLLHSVSAAEFAANHASIWSTVPLTVDRYVALCHPLLHRQISYPARARKIIAVVLMLSWRQVCLSSGGRTSSSWLRAKVGTSTATWENHSHAAGHHLCVLCAVGPQDNRGHLPPVRVLSSQRDWRVHLAYDLSNMLAMLNTAVNFFLYCFVSKPFRGAVRDVVLLRGQAPTNASISSLYSGNKQRSQRDSTPLSPRRARKPS
uniref:G protein-coupled receptor 142 n=1 Tax=Seriola dumerili TaxID=41447 RepID=A0A3B4TLZ1_SERDU